MRRRDVIWLQRCSLDRFDQERCQICLSTCKSTLCCSTALGALASGMQHTSITASLAYYLVFGDEVRLRRLRASCCIARDGENRPSLQARRKTCITLG